MFPQRYIIDKNLCQITPIDDTSTKKYSKLTLGRENKLKYCNK